MARFECLHLLQLFLFVSPPNDLFKTQIFSFPNLDSWKIPTRQLHCSRAKQNETNLKSSHCLPPSLLSSIEFITKSGKLAPSQHHPFMVDHNSFTSDLPASVLALPLHLLSRQNNDLKSKFDDILKTLKWLL